MGSSQSVPEEAHNPTSDTTSDFKESLTENVKSLSTNIETKEKPKKERMGFDLVQYKCRRRKAAYDRCYSDWYSKKFLTAEDINRDETCDELFEKWRKCVLRGMLKEREREGLPPPDKGSILGEFVEEQSDE